MVGPSGQREQTTSEGLFAFHQCLGDILNVVEHQLTSLPNHRQAGKPFDISDILTRIRSLVSESVAKESSQCILLTCQELLWFANRPEQYIESKHPDTKVSALSKVELMEHLTGAWLGLYFLGMPFAHPWERVARHAIRHGFARGAGIRKVAGDVYRKARLDMRICRAENQILPMVHVLDHNPLALSQLVEKADDGHAQVFAALGACYEFLQLRLYLREGGQINYCVFESTLRKCLDSQSGLASLWKAFELAFYCGTMTQAQQVILLESSSELAPMPACVFSDRDGIYRSSLKGTSSLDSNGNRLPATQISLYRQLLDGAKGRTVPRSENTFRLFCEQFVPPAA